MALLQIPRDPAKQAAFTECLIKMLTPEELAEYREAQECIERSVLRVSLAQAEMKGCEAELQLAQTQAQAILLEARKRIGEEPLKAVPDAEESEANG